MFKILVIKKIQKNGNNLIPFEFLCLLRNVQLFTVFFFTSVDQPCKNTGWTWNVLFLEQETAASGV